MKDYIDDMARTPFDLSFEDLTASGAEATRRARQEADRAGVPIAFADASAPRMLDAWPEERVELLKTLWSEGLSGSQIARIIGGITRNAVLSKVKNLGLTGRSNSRHHVPGSSNSQLTAVETATVLSLGAHMCKWPIGDPSSDGFTFCGRRSVEGEAYCIEHLRIAYQPAAAKKREAAEELDRRLRKTS